MESAYEETDFILEFEDSILASCSSEYTSQSSTHETLKSCSDYDPPPIDFNDNQDGFIKFPSKPSHVLLIYKNLQIGLCTDMEIKFPDATFKCHRWIIDAYMNIENLKQYPISKEKFVTEYFCCLKTPELPMLLRAYYRNSDTQDFTIYVGHEKFKCHYDVLRCYTDFFDKMKRFESVKLPIKEISIRAFFMIYNGWMLDQIPELPIRGILEVYKAAKYLRIEFLVKAIDTALENLERTKQDDESQCSRYEPPKLVNKFHIEKPSTNVV